MQKMKIGVLSLAGEEFDYSLSGALEGGPVVVYFYRSA